MTPKTKEEMAEEAAEDYRDICVRITGESRDSLRVLYAKQDFLAGFKARDEQYQIALKALKEIYADGSCTDIAAEVATNALIEMGELDHG